MSYSILRDINKEIQNYQTKRIQVVPGLYYNQYDTLNKIFFYHNSKYVTGEVDDDGDRKYFHNINRNPCKVFSKAIDFDTKNIRLLTTEGGDSLKTWFMERDLKYWMSNQQFGVILNRLFRDLPVYGTVVLKVVDGKPLFVDLRNFIVEQSAEDLDCANYIIELHNYSPAEFRKIGKQMKWKQEDIDKVIEEFHKMKDESHIKLYERYGEVCVEDGDGKKTYPYKRVFVADVGLDEYDNYGRLTVTHSGVELSSDDWDLEDNPYWEFHADKISGRWLGVGVVEELFEPQVALNQSTNLQNKTSYWAALKIFQSRDSAINRNLSTDVRNGEVLNVDSEITPINMASSENLAFFNQQDQKWLRNRDELTFSYDVVQGERLPAGTPLGSAQIAVTQTMSYFEQIQENVALAVKEMLYKVIIPQFEKDSTPEHTIRLVGKDLDKYVEMCKNKLVLEEIIRQVTSGLAFPTNEDMDVISTSIEESIKQHKEKLLTIPKGFYKDVKYDVDIDITGESMDTRVRQATVFAILQAVTADPTMIKDPVKKKILYMIAENGGINPNELFELEKSNVGDLVPQVNPVQGAGGGVSAPVLNFGVPGKVGATL